MSGKIWDVAVVGGGPGGSAAGGLLARAGRSVVILERDRFPRFHIGESLIPWGNDVLVALGVWDKIERGGFVEKLGAEFTLGNAAGLVRIWFRNNRSAAHARTFQVERSRFDQLLLQHAAELGATVQEETRVTQVTFDRDGVNLEATGPNGPQSIRARHVVDATGRDAFIGRALKVPRSDLGMPRRLAIYGHFEGVRRNEGRSAGNITIIRLPGAWFWVIPLDDHKTSVGLVERTETFRAAGSTPERYFWEVVERHAETRYRMKAAQLRGSFHTTGDYCYRHEQMAGDRWVLVGDAAGFIDPIFSSGVMVALRSGRLAAEAVAAANGKPLSAQAQRRFSRAVRGMTGSFLRLIRTFYDDAGFEVFMNPADRWELPFAVNAMVSGRTEFDLRLWWRVQLFYALCWLQRWIPIAPRVRFEPSAAEPTREPSDRVATGV